jgi:peroxiredoxin
MKNLWLPDLLILVITIVGANQLLDRRSGAQKLESTALPAAADLPVGISVGQRAPDFSATTLEGETLQLSDLQGKIVLVNLFASWCGPCRAELPHLVDVYNTLDPDQYAFVGLNLQEKPGAVETFRDEFSIPFPLAMDPEGNIAGNIFQPIGLPTSWFIDEQGVVRFVFAGPMTQSMVKQILADIQAGREPNPLNIAG